MNKVYVVTQFRFSDDKFGNLKPLPCKLIGVFTTPEKAQQAVKSVRADIYHAEHGSAKQVCLVRVVFPDSF